MFKITGRAPGKPDYRKLIRPGQRPDSETLLFYFCSLCGLLPCTRRPSVPSIVCPTGLNAGSNCMLQGQDTLAGALADAAAGRCEFWGIAAAPAMSGMRKGTCAGLSLCLVKMAADAKRRGHDRTAQQYEERAADCWRQADTIRKAATE